MHSTLSGAAIVRGRAIARTRVSVAIAVAFLIAAAPARAQTSRDRLYVTASGWFQGSSPSFDGVARPIDFAEPALVNTTYSVGRQGGFDAGAGVRVWRHLAAGADVSRFSKAGRAAVSAQVPHPFYFSRPRAVSGEAAGLTRAETAVHAQLTWMVPLNTRWQLAFGGGPSWFAIDQDVVTDVTVTQSFPFDTAEFAGVTVARRSATRVGFNAGGDVACMLRRHVGVGFGVNFSRATVPLTDEVDVDAGGLHVGGGIRFRF